ncbi:MAG: hypothetical protein AB1489_43350 [Acidobacteriota bacterium]
MPVDTIAVAKLLLDAVKLLDGKFTDHDQKEYRKLLRGLTDYRLLTSPYNAEYAGAVIASAQELREFLVSTAQALPEKSGLEQGILALGRTVRQFLSEVDSIESDIRHQLQIIETNTASGVQLDESSTNLLTHWKRNGYPGCLLGNNYNLNVMKIEWEGYRIQFLVALGTLRGQFGVPLSALCELMSTELPDDLASLTPGLEALQKDT